MKCVIVFKVMAIDWVGSPREQMSAVLAAVEISGLDCLYAVGKKCTQHTRAKIYNTPFPEKLLREILYNQIIESK